MIELKFIVPFFFFSFWLNELKAEKIFNSAKQWRCLKKGGGSVGCHVSSSGVWFFFFCFLWVTFTMRLFAVLWTIQFYANSPGLLVIVPFHSPSFTFSPLCTTTSHISTAIHFNFYSSPRPHDIFHSSLPQDMLYVSIILTKINLLLAICSLLLSPVWYFSSCTALCFSFLFPVCVCVRVHVGLRYLYGVTISYHHTRYGSSTTAGYSYVHFMFCV